MKRIKMMTAAILLIFIAAGSAHALSYSYSYSDTFSPTDQYMSNFLFVGHNTSISWVFDITDDGFAPGEQNVEAASVALHVTDDERDVMWNVFILELAMFSAGDDAPAIWEVDTGMYNFSITSHSSLSGLSSAGTMSATLTALWGDLYFNSATLFADADVVSDPTHPVPEPATMLLLGTGLVGLAGMARRRKNFKKDA